MYDFIKDPSLYNFVRGPLVWVAFIIFIGGSIYRLRSMILLAKKEKVVYPYMDLKLSLRSLLHWFIPFYSRNWRLRLVMTIVTFADDYLILSIAFLPFITGFLAYHQWLLPHKIMVILHMIFGSLMLIAIPFTRLGHMLYFFLTRAYMGSDQGYRHSKDW